MLKAGSIASWNKKQNMKSYLPTNKHSRFDLDLSSHTNLLRKGCYFVGCSLNMRHQGIGIIKMTSTRYVAKECINEVTKSRLWNETLIESKKFHFMKCPRISDCNKSQTHNDLVCK